MLVIVRRNGDTAKCYRNITKVMDTETGILLCGTNVVYSVVRDWMMIEIVKETEDGT